MTFPHNIVYTLVKNTDASYDTKYRTGNKPGSAPNVVLDTTKFISLMGVLTNIAVGTLVTIDLSSTIGGPGASASRFSLQSVSGNDPGAAGWSFNGSKLTVSVTAGNAGGVFDVVVTDALGLVYNFPQTQWSFLATSGVDVMAPTVPLGVIGTPTTAGYTLVWDSASDNFDGSITPSGLDHYNVYNGNSVVANVKATAINKGPKLTTHIIGSPSGTNTATQTKKQWSLVADGLGAYAVATDQCVFESAPLTGDQSISVTVAKFTSAYQYSTCGLMIRESIDPAAVSVALYLHPVNNGIRAAIKTTTGGLSGNVFQLLNIDGPIEFRIDRVGSLFTFLYSTDGHTWTVLGSSTVAMASQCEYGVFATSRNPGNPITGVFTDLNLAVRPQLTTNVATTVSQTVGVTSVDVAGNESAKSSILILSPTIISPTGKVKAITGNGFYPNNQFWGTTANPGTAQVVYKSMLALAQSNTNVTLILLSLSYADVAGPTQGDWSKGLAIIQGVLADLAKITTHKVGLMVKLWLTYFTGEPSLPGRTDTKSWPAYAISNGWTMSFYEAGFGRSQLDWNNNAVWADMTKGLTFIGSAVNSHPNMLSLGFQDETEAISVISKMPDNTAHPEITSQPAPYTNGQTVMDSTNYNTQFEALMNAMSDSMPNTLTHVPWNYLPPGGPTEVGIMAGIINRMLASRPGKFIFGGPDPWTHNTTYHNIAGGLNPALADIRRSFMQVSEVQQGSETGNGNPTVPAIYARNIGTAAPTPAVLNADGSVKTPAIVPGCCQCQIWPYIPDGAAGQKSTLSTFLAAIAANNGQTAPMPLVGSYTVN